MLDPHRSTTHLRDDEFTLDVEHTIAADQESDYGDLACDAEELEIVDRLLEQFASDAEEHAPFMVTDIEDYEAPRGLRLPKVLGVERTRRWEVLVSSPDHVHTVLDLNSPHSEARRHDNDSGDEEEEEVERNGSLPEAEAPTGEPDTRSPLERFRRPPKKALSVTDLASPAWCELQYFYTLSKHGRKRRTPAMRQGTRVHQALEDEIHVTVPVETTKKEDSWGLRVWNVIQGLKTLRETGRTREFEIWGSIGGEVVNGIIDELSYECPDPKLDQNGQPEAVGTIPEYQTSITDYLLSGAEREQGRSISEALATEENHHDHDVRQRRRQKRQQEKRIYIIDVKTRGSPTLPTGASIRPTIVQLHLYHHMLENLVQGHFPLVRLTERYDLNPHDTFSDSFIAQIGSLNQDLFDAASQGNDSPAASVMASQDSMDILLQHNTLSLLWDLMMSQFRQTFLLPARSSHDTTPQSLSDLPQPAALPTRLSPVLTAEYLSPTYRHGADKEKTWLGRKSFIFNAIFLKSYLEDTLAWWRGEREARGVQLQEAWKCRSCDFRDDCEWIHERNAAALREVHERRKLREIAGAEGWSAPSKSNV